MIMQCLADRTVFVDVVPFYMDSTGEVDRLFGTRLGSCKRIPPQKGSVMDCLEVEVPGEPPIILCHKDYVVLHSTGNITALTAQELTERYGLAVAPGTVMQ
jgi:hypothetical protein